MHVHLSLACEYWIFFFSLRPGLALYTVGSSLHVKTYPSRLEDPIAHSSYFEHLRRVNDINATRRPNQLT